MSKINCNGFLSFIKILTNKDLLQDQPNVLLKDFPSCLLTAVKDGLQLYCETTYSGNGINQMWILENSKCLLENLRSNVLQTISCVKALIFPL